MNDNNLHKIFAATECVSTDVMMDYINGKLSEKQKNKVEVHLTSCEMCRDEFEGLSFLEDSSKLTTIVDNLNQKIDDKLVLKRGRIISFRPLYKIAAAIIILISFGWFIKFYVDSSTGDFNDEMVSQAIEEHAKEEQLIKDSEKPEEMAPKTTDEKIKEKKDLVKKQPKTEKVIIDKTVVDNEVTATEDTELDDIVSVEKEENIAGYVDDKEKIISETGKVEEGRIDDSKLKGVTEENKALANEVSGERDEVVTDDVLENRKKELRRVRGDGKRSNKKLSKAKDNTLQPAVSSNTIVLDNFDLGMAAYNKREYNTAINLFKQSLKDHSNKDEVHFYLANSQVNIKEIDKAITNYNKVIAVPESPYYEEALWNKSQLLLELNKRKSAINSLNQLRSYRGSYEKQANQIIDSLEKKPVNVEGDK